jgi:hypothetical protein
MMNNMPERFDKLKKVANERCWERIIGSQENTPGAITATGQFRVNTSQITIKKIGKGL